MSLSAFRSHGEGAVGVVFYAAKRGVSAVIVNAFRQHADVQIVIVVAFCKHVIVWIINYNVILYVSVAVGILLIVCIIVICIVKRNRRKNDIEDSNQDNLKKMVEVSPELNEPIPVD